MTERKSISKKYRFEVFKRDDFSCQYCGRMPPTVTLEVDHILPVCEKGSDDKYNLITACFDCNRGKGGSLLEKVPQTLAKQAEIQREREAQVKAYERMLKASQRRLNKSVSIVENIFRETFPDGEFTSNFRQSVKRFIEKLTETEVCDSAHYSVSRMEGASPERAAKYFCGVCWGKIKDRGL